MNLKFLGYSALFTSFFAPEVIAQKTDLPNIIIILADDMGYSDLGCYGSEINTPNLDKLAAEGLRFTQFYNAGKSCPSRSSLLTGQYSHKVGVGAMDEDKGLPGYRGRLNDSCLTIAELLKPANYKSYVVGKWHVGRSFESLPLQRGFDRFYGSSTANGSYYGLGKDRKMYCNNYEIIPKGEWNKAGEIEYQKFDNKNDKQWYSTDVFTDSAMQYINDHVSSTTSSPFFLYLAYTAPHWPLHALPEDIEKYKEVYKKGWDVIREERLKKMIELGILDSSYQLSLRDEESMLWDTVQNKEYWSDLMATYAAMVDRMDQNIGRLLDIIKQHKIDDNTMIIFLSDNGGSNERISKQPNNAPVGSSSSYDSYKSPWANVSNTPFRRFKSWNHEGGISTPFIIKYPRVIEKKGTNVNIPYHIVDIFASIMDITNSIYPNEKTKPLDGISFIPAIKNEELINQHECLYWEYIGNKAVRCGNWKLVKEKYKNQWELYNLEYDRIETINLYESFPEKVNELESLWQKWANSSNVIY